MIFELAVAGVAVVMVVHSFCIYKLITKQIEIDKTQLKILELIQSRMTLEAGSKLIASIEKDVEFSIGPGAAKK